MRHQIEWQPQADRGTTQATEGPAESRVDRVGTVSSESRSSSSNFGTADRSEPLPVIGIRCERRSRPRVQPHLSVARANVHHAPQQVLGGASGATTVIQTQVPSQSGTRTFRHGQPLSSTVGVSEEVEVFTDVVVLGGLVGLGLAMDIAAGAVPGVAVAAAVETVTATATEVTAVTAASVRRVVGEWRVPMPIAFHRRELTSSSRPGWDPLLVPSSG